MTKEQPEFMNNVMDQIQIIRKEDAGDKITLTMFAEWEKLLADVSCRTPKSANLLFKTSKSEWQREPLVIEKGLPQESIQLPRICLDHSLQLEVIGYAGTDPILTEVDIGSDNLYKVC